MRPSRRLPTVPGPAARRQARRGMTVCVEARSATAGMLCGWTAHRCSPWSTCSPPKASSAGWMAAGGDAPPGQQTRPHADLDLDLAVDAAALDRLLARLG